MQSQNERQPIKTINDLTLDMSKIRFELERFLEKHPFQQNQVCLNDRERSSAFDPYEGIGSAHDDSQNLVKFFEYEFTRWCDLLHNTETLRQIQQLESLGYPIGRARLMRLMPRSCYSFHRDETKRIHLVIKPDTQAALLFPPDKILKIPDDNRFHLVDTTQVHSAMNGGLSERIHLVLALRY